MLPPDFPAPVLMVLHIPHNAVSVMPEILRRAGTLPAVHAASREPLRPGRIYVAPPDRHLILTDSVVTAVFGPRENGHRPAIDPLFRSAAKVYGSRAIGVVLTGNLDDGTAGLLAIKKAGGTTIVQDPREAVHNGMPLSAIRAVDVDDVVILDEIVPAILRALSEDPPPGKAEMEEGSLDFELSKATMDPNAPIEQKVGEPSGFTCPECAGGLWEVIEGRHVRYRCRVGHAYSVDSLGAAYGSSVEAALWAALRALEENAEFANRLAQRSESMNYRNAKRRFTEQARIATEHAAKLRAILASGPVLAETSEEVMAPE